MVCMLYSRVLQLELEDRERLTFRIPRYVMAMDVSDM
jgi:hypothetical protein